MEETIFSYIDSILFNKKKLNNLNEGETQFSLFMVNRWCSMYSSELAEIINETTNKYKDVLVLKQDQYNFCYNVFPKVKKKKIEYIKKQKAKESQEANNNYLAEGLEISKREAQQYIDFLEELHN